MISLSKRIGVDLGTTNTRIFHEKSGVILNEPTVAALAIDSDKVLAVGVEALEMIGRTPETIRSVRPIQSGVIADFRVTQQMLKIYFNKSLGSLRMRLPEIMLTVSGGATSTEEKAALDIARAAGAKQIHVIKSAVSAALGANLPIADPTGHLIIDIGGGSTEIAVISLGGVVASSSIRIGGDSINRKISIYLRNAHNLSIGEQTAEDIKLSLGTAIPKEKDYKIVVQGRDQVGGLPKSIELHSNEIVPLIEDVAEKIVRSLRGVIEATPPELVSDIMQKGIALSGGSAQLKDFDRLLSKVIGVPVIVVQDPELAVVKGTGLALSNLNDYKKSLLGWQ
jgi:rod shape-determining protein MreB